MPNTHSTLTSLFSDIADSIRAKTGSQATIVADDFPDAIDAIPTGGGSEPAEKDVNFYDYDGTLVYSYTKAEFLALTVMPSNPSHTGLVAQGWNWTLSDAKTYVTACGILDIGQNYVTDDGKTRFYITVGDNKTITALWGREKAWEYVTINWGDGSAEESYNTSLAEPSHTYASSGDYVITLTPESLETDVTVGNFRDQNSMNAITKIEVGTGVKYIRSTIQNVTVYGNNLKTISIPNTVGYIVDCQNLTALEAFVIPPNATYNGYFKKCISLRTVCFPYTSTTNQFIYKFFDECYNLQSVTLPSNITSFDFNTANSLNNAIPSNGQLKRFATTQAGSNINISDFKNFKYVALPSLTAQLKLYRCSSLETAVLSNSWGFQIQSLYYDYRLPGTITLPSSVTDVSAWFAEHCYNVEAFVFNGDITNIGSQSFNSCVSCLLYDFRNNTAVPTYSGMIGTGINPNCKIVVPDSLYNDWIAASGWSSLASYIISASDYANL